MNNIEKLNTKIREYSIEKLFLSAQIEELNVYNQAHLTLETPMIKTKVLHEQTKNEEQVTFPIHGDYTGFAIAFLDTFNKNIENEDLILLKNLFTESINILLGQFFTRIEKIGNTSLILGSPSIMSRINLKSIKQDKSSETYSTGYSLLFNGKELSCRVIYFLNKNKLIEV